MYPYRHLRYYLCVYIHICIYIYTHTYIYIYCIYIHIYMCVYIDMCIYNIYTHVYIYTHTRFSCIRLSFCSSCIPNGNASIAIKVGLNPTHLHALTKCFTLPGQLGWGWWKLFSVCCSSRQSLPQCLSWDLSGVIKRLAATVRGEVGRWKWRYFLQNDIFHNKKYCCQMFIFH